MTKQRRVAFVLALFGFLLPAALFMHDDMTDYAYNAVSQALSVLCPAYILGGYFFDFFDVNGHNWIGLFGMLFLAILNASLYFGLGMVIGRYLQRRSSIAVTKS